ncbi:putative integral membrane protein conserved region-domain-containing protein [Coemansia spiralis]|nr:putative integral membrane protein conserved region-domain-containing protein [Coemansia spiralis]
MQISVIQLLLTYLLGFLTLPVILAIGAFLVWASLPDAFPSTNSQELLSSSAESNSKKGLQDKHADAQTEVSPYGARRSGWLRITRHAGFQPKLSDIVTRGIAKWVQNRRNSNKKPEGGASSAGASATAAAAAATTLDTSQDMYYAMLVGDTLVMYDSEAMHECRGVIIMSKHRVTLHHNPDVTESQVYSRRTPIKLSPLDDGHSSGLYKRQVPEYYIYADKPVDKEDWYFALVWSSLSSAATDSSSDDDRDYGSRSNGDPNINDDRLETKNVETTSSESSAPAANGHKREQSSDGANNGEEGAADLERPKLTKAKRERMLLRMRRSCLIPDHPGIASILNTISTRGAFAKQGEVREDEWLNAMFGRIFVATYRTEWARKHFIRKMQSKFDRVQRPMFLERLVVSDLDVGDNVPIITNPKLESFDANGQVDASMYVHYMGGFKLVLNTSVKIGSLRLSIALSVVLESLAGKLLVRFKPAPSNRVWIGFYEMPKIRLKLSPVFMQKEVKYAAISQAIEKQIYDIVRISMVLPNMDDTVFFPTPHEDGGIFEASLKAYKDAGLDEEVVSDEESKQAIESETAQPAKDAQDVHSAGTGLGLDSEHLRSAVQRPLSFPSVDSHANTMPLITSSFDQYGIGENTSHNDSEQHDLSALRINENIANSSYELMANYRSQLRETRERMRSTESLHSNSSSTAPSVSASSIKSAISTSAATFFKQSAKTWWKSMQQSGQSSNENNGNNKYSPGASSMPPPLPRRPPTENQPAKYQMYEESDHSPPRAASEVNSNSQHSSSGIHNSGFSGNGATIKGSAVTAALSQSEIELPIQQRRYSNAAKPNTNVHEQSK